MRSAATRSLPCPGVRFEAGFARRLDALARRLADARSRRESGGAPRAAAGGSEFVGYRPYAPGDDPRSIDWDLVARSDRAWVKVARREAGERWLVALDASASMGVGPPGKLQRAAEVAAGIAALALSAGAEARIAVTPGGRGLAVARKPDLADAHYMLATVLKQQGDADGADRLTPAEDCLEGRLQHSIGRLPLEQAGADRSWRAKGSLSELICRWMRMIATPVLQT